MATDPQKSELTFKEILDKIALNLIGIDKKEIAIKLQEIKHVSEKYYLFDGLPVEDLEEHSRQCEIALKAAIGDIICENELSNHPKPRIPFDENVDYPMICQEDDDIYKLSDFLTDESKFE